MTGYKAISELYDAGKVKNSRDNETPVCFVESVHSIGEWKSVHKLKTITDCLWQYDHNDDWYLCTQKRGAKTDKEKQPGIQNLQSLISNLTNL